MKKIALVAVLGTVFALPMLSHAESDLQTAASGSLTATAHPDFRTKAPKAQAPPAVRRSCPVKPG